MGEVCCSSFLCAEYCTCQNHHPADGYLHAGCVCCDKSLPALLVFTSYSPPPARTLLMSEMVLLHTMTGLSPSLGHLLQTTKSQITGELIYIPLFLFIRQDFCGRKERSNCLSFDSGVLKYVMLSLPEPSPAMGQNQKQQDLNDCQATELNLRW